MLIVMMILLVATTLAGVSLQATEYELRAAGFARSALQTQYVSEAALSTTMAWLDAGYNGPGIKKIRGDWNGRGGPNMAEFGEPQLTATNNLNTMRTAWDDVQSRMVASTMAPITRPGEGDPIGSFGPRISARPGEQNPINPDAPSDYVVDVYDCVPVPVTQSREQINRGGSSTKPPDQWACVVTSRGRSYVPGGSTRKWRDPNGIDYTVNRFALAHDSRGTFVSPPEL